MSSPQQLVDGYSSKVCEVVSVPGECCGVCDLRDGRIAWTVKDTAKVVCYDEDADCTEWTVPCPGKPHGICFVFDEEEQPRVWVSDADNDCIYLLDAGTGEHEITIPMPDSPGSDDPQPSGTFDGKGLKSPRGLTHWEDVPEPGSSEVWVADSGNDRLVAFHPQSGETLRTMGQSFVQCPLDVTAMDSKRLAVVCRSGGHVFDPEGNLLCRFNFHMMIGNAVAFDPRGDHGLLVVADEYTDRLVLFDAASGDQLRIFRAATGEGSFAHKGLAWHEGEEGYGRRVYIADGLQRRISKVAVGPQSRPPTPPPERPAFQMPGMEPPAEEGDTRKKK